jgi:hypothetical protein
MLKPREAGLGHFVGMALFVALGCSEGREPAGSNHAGASGASGDGSGGAGGGGSSGGAGAGGDGGGAAGATSGGAAGATSGGAAGATSGGAGGARGGAAGAGGAAGQAGTTCRGLGGALGGSSQVQPRGAAAPAGCNDGGGQMFPRSDECGCRDLVCDPAKTCLRVFQPPPSALGGPGNYFNGCFEVCNADAECGANRVCALDFYGVRKCVPWVCRTTPECTADPCGVCRLGRAEFHASWILNEAANACLYEGPCGTSSCATCVSSIDGAHRCP